MYVILNLFYLYNKYPLGRNLGEVDEIYINLAMKSEHVIKPRCSDMLDLEFELKKVSARKILHMCVMKLVFTGGFTNMTRFVTFLVGLSSQNRFSGCRNGFWSKFGNFYFCMLTIVRFRN